MSGTTPHSVLLDRSDRKPGRPPRRRVPHRHPCLRALQHLTWHTVVYALFSLTVIRLLPVALTLVGSGLRPASVAYIGWFGRRGLASLVFGLLARSSPWPWS
ncbi:hypothetical protein OG373_37820 [Streptomyces avidinii]|uniref:hypothetical protein n=1 Tax=Streptomyces avidinii TaxID=1895 RepID=UPI0038654F0B|nr:hypothetical protein OG373_37820 [Streptomyces avidinii]